MATRMPCTVSRTRCKCQVYDQPPPASRPKTADPPGYDRYRKALEQRAAGLGGVRLPGAAESQPPRSPRAEEMARLELELQQAETAENYSGAARLRGELDALRKTVTTSRPARLAAELAEAVAREDFAAATRLRKELALAEEQPE